jgi:hypothetical protein
MKYLGFPISDKRLGINAFKVLWSVVDRRLGPLGPWS